MLRFGEALDLHIAVLGLPLVVLLHEHGADQASDGVLVWEDADDSPCRRCRSCHFWHDAPQGHADFIIPAKDKADVVAYILSLQK